MPIDPSDFQALDDAIKSFQASYADLMHAANRIVLLDRMERKGLLMTHQARATAKPEPAKPEPARSAKAMKKKMGGAGFLGDPCQNCGMFMLIRVGTCIRCSNCAWDSGCG